MVTWMIDRPHYFEELLHCNVSRCSPMETCVITIGKYQSVNNLCHLLPFYTITVFWSCGLALFAKESSIQVDYLCICYNTDQRRDSLCVWYYQPLWTKWCQLWPILRWRGMKENSNVAKNISNESVEDASSSDRKLLLHVFLRDIQL